MLDGGKVVCFAHLDIGEQRTGKTVHKVAGVEMPPFRGLVIIEENLAGPYYLLYCDDEWNSLTDTWHETLEDAKAQAQFEYEGIAQAWEVLPSDA
jgi:hypothetical protein